MAELKADTCRENADIWTAKAAETNLPQLRQSYLASATVWIQQAERIEHSAVLRAKRVKDAELARAVQLGAAA